MHILLLAALTSFGVQDTIPFELIKNQIVLSVDVGERPPVRMLLDTGVNPSGVDLQLAREMGWLLSDTPSGSAGGAGTDVVPIYAARLAGLTLGRTRLEPIDAAAMDLGPLAERLGRPFHGVLGYRFLEGRRVRIDYPGRRVILEPADDPALTVLFADSLRFVAGDIIPRAVIRVAGKEVPVSLDTGSSLTLELWPDAARRAGIDRAGLPEQRATGARGEFVVRVGRAPTVALGAIERSDVEVHLPSRARGSPDREGNLGNGFLREFVLTLDYRGRRWSLAVPPEPRG